MQDFVCKVETSKFHRMLKKGNIIIVVTYIFLIYLKKKNVHISMYETHLINITELKFVKNSTFTWN